MLQVFYFGNLKYSGKNGMFVSNHPENFYKDCLNQQKDSVQLFSLLFSLISIRNYKNVGKVYAHFKPLKRT